VTPGASEEGDGQALLYPDRLAGLDAAYTGVAKQALQYNLLHLHLDGNYK
jgi:hypothetical protein